MLKYSLKRIGVGIITVYLIATFTFFGMHMVPGNPLATPKAVPEEIWQNILKKYQLDKPLHVQYFSFLKNMVQGDFGISYTQKNRRVNDIIQDHFPVSAILGLLSLAMAVVGGVIFGGVTAYARNKWPDHLVMVFVIVAISVPTFVFGALAQVGMLNLKKWLGFELLPIAGWDGFKSMIMPATIQAMGTLAFFTRLMRSSFLETIHADYSRTAKSKGLSQWQTFSRHQVRNGILPMISILGPVFVGITTHGFVVESIFTIPGLGRYFVWSVQQLDYTTIMGLTVFYSTFLVLGVIAFDIIQGLVDPRIREGKS